MFFNKITADFFVTAAGLFFNHAKGLTVLNYICSWSYRIFYKIHNLAERSQVAGYLFNLISLFPRIIISFDFLMFSSDFVTIFIKHIFNFSFS